MKILATVLFLLTLVQVQAAEIVTNTDKKSFDAIKDYLEKNSDKSKAYKRIAFFVDTEKLELFRKYQTQFRVRQTKTKTEISIIIRDTKKVPVNLKRLPARFSKIAKCDVKIIVGKGAVNYCVIKMIVDGRLAKNEVTQMFIDSPEFDKFLSASIHTNKIKRLIFENPIKPFYAVLMDGKQYLSKEKVWTVESWTNKDKEQTFEVSMNTTKDTSKTDVKTMLQTLKGSGASTTNEEKSNLVWYFSNIVKEATNR